MSVRRNRREDEGICWLLVLQVPEKLIQSRGLLGGRVSGVIRPHQCGDISDGVA